VRITSIGSNAAPHFDATIFMRPTTILNIHRARAPDLLSRVIDRQQIGSRSRATGKVDTRRDRLLSRSSLSLSLSLSLLSGERKRVSSSVNVDVNFNPLPKPTFCQPLNHVALAATRRNRNFIFPFSASPPSPPSPSSPSAIPCPAVYSHLFRN